MRLTLPKAKSIPNDLNTHQVDAVACALRWDNEPSTTTLAELNESQIRRFVERARMPWDNSTNALTKLGLMQDGQPANVARLFFADQPIQLRCAVFASITSATILDRHNFDGDILELIEYAEKYILKHIHIGMRVEGLRRVDLGVVGVRRAKDLHHPRQHRVHPRSHVQWHRRHPDGIHPDHRSTSRSSAAHSLAGQLRLTTKSPRCRRTCTGVGATGADGVSDDMPSGNASAMNGAGASALSCAVKVCTSLASRSQR